MYDIINIYLCIPFMSNIKRFIHDHDIHDSRQFHSLMNNNNHSFINQNIDFDILFKFLFLYFLKSK